MPDYGSGSVSDWLVEWIEKISPRCGIDIPTGILFTKSFVTVKHLVDVELLVIPIQINHRCNLRLYIRYFPVILAGKRASYVRVYVSLSPDPSRTLF